MGAQLPSTLDGKKPGAASQNDLLQGTLGMLILRILRSGDMHGWSIADRIQLVSKDVLSVGEGSLYPALYRLRPRAGSTRPGASQTTTAITEVMRSA